MKGFFKSVAAKILIAVALLLLGIMIYAATTSGVSSIPETITGVIVTPIQKFWSGMTGGIVSFFDSLTADSRELERLQEENDRLHQMLADYEQRVQENDFYKEYLGIKQAHPDFQFASGRVISSDPSDPYHNFTISAGTQDGVTAGAPVITAQGLVGTVYEAGPSWAKVRTILDPSAQVGAMINRISENCITSGSVSLARSGKLRAELLPLHSGVAVGDDVVTSGISEKYPSGLLIGTVDAVSVGADGASTNVIIKPYADFSSLSSVLVLISFDVRGNE